MAILVGIVLTEATMNLAAAGMAVAVAEVEEAATTAIVVAVVAVKIVTAVVMVVAAPRAVAAVILVVIVADMAVTAVTMPKRWLIVQQVSLQIIPFQA